MCKYFCFVTITYYVTTYVKLIKDITVKTE